MPTSSKGIFETKPSLPRDRHNWRGLFGSPRPDIHALGHVFLLRSVTIAVQCGLGWQLHGRPSGCIKQELIRAPPAKDIMELRWSM